MPEIPPPTLIRRDTPPALRPFVSSIAGYAEHGSPPPPQREAASLDVPIVVSFGSPFGIGFDRASGAAVSSFVAGLHPGYVAVASDGRACCVQINFTPLGARLALGLPMHLLTSRTVPLDDLGNRGVAALAARLADLADWPARLALAEGWSEARVREGAAGRSTDARATTRAYLDLCRSGGNLRIQLLADRLGWSRKRFGARFREEIGLPPKVLARILRFRHACALAGAEPATGWAEIAAASGYSDQAHLTREFRGFAGVTPAAWACGPH